jgi:APA family basic amino acid/polyamine antiporter
MMAVAVVFSFASHIAHRGISSIHECNMVINIVQITALLIFAVLAINIACITFPARSPTSSTRLAVRPTPTSSRRQRCQNRRCADVIDRDASAFRCHSSMPASRSPSIISYPTTDATGNFLTHENAKSVVSPHKISWVFIQATVAILILVGFESVTDGRRG